MPTRRECPSPIYWARIAGLPAGSVESFGSDRLRQRFADRHLVETELTLARSSLADSLHAAVGRADPADRRLLLALRRDCFNGRSLAKYQTSGQLQRLEWALGTEGRRVALLEERLELLDREVSLLYEHDLYRERQALLAHLSQEGLIRGISLASRDLASHLNRLRLTPFDRFGRRERRLEISLLRYVTRAALKLSPYSSLTRVALGTVQDEIGEASLRLATGPWWERSLFRLNRYLVDQYQQALFHCPAVRRRLRVELTAPWRRSTRTFFGFSVRDAFRSSRRKAAQARTGGIGASPIAGRSDLLDPSKASRAAVVAGDLVEAAARGSIATIRRAQ